MYLILCTCKFKCVHACLCIVCLTMVCKIINLNWLTTHLWTLTSFWCIIQPVATRMWVTSSVIAKVTSKFSGWFHIDVCNKTAVMSQGVNPSVSLTLTSSPWPAFEGTSPVKQGRMQCLQLPTNEESPSWQLLSSPQYMHVLVCCTSEHLHWWDVMCVHCFRAKTFVADLPTHYVLLLFVFLCCLGS